MSKDIKDFLPYYIGQQAMTPDGIGTIVGLPWSIVGRDRVAIHFGKCILTKNSIDGGYNKKRYHGHYLVAEKHYQAIATSDPDFDSFSMPGGVKPILRKLESLQHNEIVELFRLRNWLQPETISRTGNERGFIQMEGTKHGEYFSDWQDLITIYPAQFHYLLSRGFDLFGLIDAGLAIDKETLKPTP